MIVPVNNVSRTALKRNLLPEIASPPQAALKTALAPTTVLLTGPKVAPNLAKTAVGPSRLAHLGMGLGLTVMAGVGVAGLVMACGSAGVVGLVMLPVTTIFTLIAGGMAVASFAQAAQGVAKQAKNVLVR